MHALRKDETRCSNSHIETGSSTSQWLRRIGHRPLRPHLSGCNCWRGPRRSARPQAKTPFAPRHDRSLPAGREGPNLDCCRPSGLRTASTFAFPGRFMTARVLPGRSNHTRCGSASRAYDTGSENRLSVFNVVGISRSSRGWAAESTSAQRRRRPSPLRIGSS